MANYFDDRNREFIIKDMYPRRPWQNVIWNDKTLAKIDQFGFGESFSLLCNTRRFMDKAERLIYVKDRKTGEFYSANRNYNKLPFNVFECHVGLGYQKIISEYNGIYIEFTITVPKNASVLQFLIKAKNVSNDKKDFDLYFYNKPQPDISSHDSYAYADFNKNLGGILYSFNAYASKCPYEHLFLSSEIPALSFDTDDDRFCGVYNNLDNPISLKNDTLSSKGVSYGKYVGAFQYRLSLSPGEEFNNVIACGIGQDVKECIEIAEKYTNKDSFANSLKDQFIANKECLEAFLLESDDEILNSQVNIWLKRQISLGKTWGRIYGKGFRDTLQDLTAFVSFDYDFARERLLYILRHQFEDGNAIRMFEPNLRYPYNDGATWIPSAVLSYISETGDNAVLDEQIKYIKGTTKENTSFFACSTFQDYDGICTDYTETLFLHVKKSMDYLYSCRGKRGLVLLLGGDWNDSLNNAGRLGKGEGVWLTIATIKAYREFIEILKAAKKDELIREYELRIEELKKAVIQHGYIDGHFIYCFNDYDELIGAESNEEGKFFLNPQTWAVLGDVADKEILNSVMDQVEDRLKCDFGYVMCTPSYTKGDEHIGRVSYFRGGNVENGSVYNHGVAFKAVADCLLGRGDNAYNTLKLISYDNPKNADSGVEPYAVTNMYIGPDNPYLTGYAPYSWVTGSAGWVYRCITEYLCGIQPLAEGIKIRPCVPSKWNKFNVKRRLRGVNYNISFERGNENKIYLNDKEVIGNVVPLQKSNSTIKVIYC